MGKIRGRFRGGGRLRTNGFVKKAGKASDVKMRLGKKTSEVWNFFEQMAHAPGENPKSRCNICNVVFKCPGGSTTGMRGHLERKHPGTLSGTPINSMGLTITPVPATTSKIEVEYDDDDDVGGVDEDFSMDNMDDSEAYLDETNVSNNSDAHPLDFYDEDEDEFPDPEAAKGDFEHDEISRSLAYMCVLDLKPLSLHEGDGFRNFVSYFDSSYVLASYTSPDSIKSVAACIEDMYENEASKMRRELLNKDVCLSVETWNKNNLDNYVIITAHFVTNDCTFSSRLLSTKLLPRLATITPDQMKLKSNFLSVVKEGAGLFGIHEDQITSIVVNSDLFEQVETGPDVLIVPCLNTIVKLCFNNLQQAAATEFGYDVFDAALKLAYKYIPDYEHLRRNPYSLLMAMEDHQSTLEQIEDNKIQWNYLPAIIALLAPVNDVIDITSDEDKVFLSTVFPLICAIKAQLMDTTEEFKNDASMKPVIESFTKVIMDTLQHGYQIDLDSQDYGSYLICICSLLDPRFKALKFVNDEQRKSIHNATLALMTESAACSTSSKAGKTDTLRSSKNREVNGSSSSSSKTIQTRSRYTSDSTVSSNESSTVLQRILGNNWEFVPSSEATNELQKYLNQPVPAVSTDPLAWWSQRKRLYPNLSSVALNFLGISAIASSAQHVFTKLGAELDQTRGALEENYVDKILFLHRIVKNSLAEPSAEPSSQFHSALSVSEMDVYDDIVQNDEDLGVKDVEDEEQVC